MLIIDKIIFAMNGLEKEELHREEIIDKVLKYFPDTNRSSVIPSDYCYNRTNKGSNTISLFLWIQRGIYQYVGRNYFKKDTLKGNSMLIKGKVRSPDLYADGTKRIEIWFPKEKLDELPIKVNQRVEIEIVIYEKKYMAGIRHTDNNPYIWISPNCKYKDKEVRLSNIIFDAGFKVNDEILIDFIGDRATVVLHHT